MKNKLFILVLICTNLYTYSQTIFYNGFGSEGPGHDLLIVDNYLYSGAYSGGYIVRFNLDNPNPQPETISTNFLQGSLFSLSYYQPENALYISSFSPVLSKLDLSQTLPANSETININPANFFFGNDINGEMFYGATTNGGFGYIYKMNISQGPSSYEILYQDALSLYHAETYNGELYFISTGSEIDLNKIDPNSSNPDKMLVASSISSVFPAATHLRDNYLYVGNDNGQLVRFNLDDSLPLSPTVLLNDIGNNIVGISSKNELLYISVGGPGIIYTFEDHVLSTIETDISSISIYPNPSDDYLFLNSKKNNINYQIFNLQNQEIKKGNYNDSGILISNLTSGIYMLKLEIEERISFQKFIKK
ncbi:MAG: hypothetical protein CMC14_11290 [Flavobacteriaceae bacterium]|nr:hypothetical protein [Flavobacteriaceae bacterium]|tara:strand:- start:1091 stop:2179 length:1089 start_codon:yes stop_codon:yes gene_type:complete